MIELYFMATKFPLIRPLEISPCPSIPSFYFAADCCFFNALRYLTRHSLVFQLHYHIEEGELREIQLLLDPVLEKNVILQIEERVSTPPPPNLVKASVQPYTCIKVIGLELSDEVFTRTSRSMHRHLPGTDLWVRWDLYRATPIRLYGLSIPMDRLNIAAFTTSRGTQDLFSPGYPSLQRCRYPFILLQPYE